MLLKLYSLLVITLDLISLVFKAFFCYLELVYRVLFPRTLKSVEGEIVLVTGAGHGIGRELCLQFSKIGAVVVCWDVDVVGNNETVMLVKQSGGRAYAFKCDVADQADVTKVADQVRHEVGDVTILVNNAGIMPCHPLGRHSPREIERMFAVNVHAHFWTLSEFLPRMMEMNHGHIVCLSSVAGLVGSANVVPYCASKFAVRGLMEALSEELRATGRYSNIHLTTVYPFVVSTGLVQKPKTRFPSVFPLTRPEVAAARVIEAVRRNDEERTIPDIVMPIYLLSRMWPPNLRRTVADFFGCGCEAHDD